MIFSNSPDLKLQKLLVFGALGLYLIQQLRLQAKGQLAGDDSLLLKIDKKNIFDSAAKRFNMNKIQRSLLEGVYDELMKDKDDEKAT
jgi:hypothetical protein